jgi:hypothetical protein
VETGGEITASKFAFQIPGLMQNSKNFYMGFSSPVKDDVGLNWKTSEALY